MNISYIHIWYVQQCESPLSNKSTTPFSPPFPSEHELWIDLNAIWNHAKRYTHHTRIVSSKSTEWVGIRQISFSWTQNRMKRIHKKYSARLILNFLKDEVFVYALITLYYRFVNVCYYYLFTLFIARKQASIGCLQSWAEEGQLQQI